MIIIAFAPNTSKLLPKIMCRKFKHCAVVAKNQKDLTMYQFITHGHSEKISLRNRDLKILAGYGWRFVYVPNDLPCDFNPYSAWSCVDMCKRAIKLHEPWIQTPYALFRRLSQ